MAALRGMRPTLFAAHRGGCAAGRRIQGSGEAGMETEGELQGTGAAHGGARPGARTAGAYVGGSGSQERTARDFARVAYAGSLLWITDREFLPRGTGGW